MTRFQTEQTMQLVGTSGFAVYLHKIALVSVTALSNMYISSHYATTLAGSPCPPSSPYSDLLGFAQAVFQYELFLCMWACIEGAITGEM